MVALAEEILEGQGQGCRVPKDEAKCLKVRLRAEGLEQVCWVLAFLWPLRGKPWMAWSHPPTHPPRWVCDGGSKRVPPILPTGCICLSRGLPVTLLCSCEGCPILSPFQEPRDLDPSTPHSPQRPPHYS